MARDGRVRADRAAGVRGRQGRPAAARVRRRAVGVVPAARRGARRPDGRARPRDDEVAAGARRPRSSSGRIREAARHVELERLAISPQCGFATSVVGNALTPDDQRAKLETLARPRRGCGDRESAGGGNHGPRPSLSVTIRSVPALLTHIPSVLVVCPGQRDRLNLADERILERFALQLAGQPIAPGVRPARIRRPHRALRAGRRRGHRIERRDRAPRRRAGRAPRSAGAGPGGVHALPRQAGLAPDPGRGGARGHPGVRRGRPRRARRAGTAAVPVLPEARRGPPLAARIPDRRAVRATPPRSPRRAPTIDAVTAYDRALEGRTFRTLIAEELLDGVLVTFEGLHVRRADDSGRRHRRRHAPERDQLPAVRVPERPPRRACRPAMAEVAARLMPALGFDGVALQHRVLRPPRRVGDDRRGERADGVAVRAARQGRPRRLDLRAPARARERPDARPAARPRRHGGGELPRARRTTTRSCAPCPIPTAVLERFGHAHVEVLVRPGQRLSENDDDIVSHRLAVVALAGPRPRVGAAPLRRGGRAAAVRARRATGTGLGALVPCPPDRRAYACQPWPSKPTETTRPSSTTVGTMRVPSV